MLRIHAFLKTPSGVFFCVLFKKPWESGDQATETPRVILIKSLKSEFI